MKRFFIAFAVLAVVITANTYAAEKFLHCVQKITVVCNCDIEFLKKTFNVQEEGNYVDVFYTHTPAGSGALQQSGGKNGDFMLVYGQYKTEKNDFPLPQFRYYFLKKSGLIVLPPFEKTSRDDAMEYVYTGSWIITLDPYNFKVTDIKVEDEYDQAKEWLEKKKGAKTAAKLVRGELLPFGEGSNPAAKC